MKAVISLVKRVQEGDRTAFNELYRQHYLSLRSYAGLLVGEEEAEDIVQDVFLNVWIHRENLDDSLSFRGYLLRAAYNSALNVLKKKNYSDDYCSACEKEIREMGYRYYDPDNSEVIQRLYNRDLHREIHAAIDNLPTRCREVFSLSYLQGIPSKEISRQLGISLSTVENHIYAALKLLRKQLIQYKINGMIGVILYLLR